MKQIKACEKCNVVKMVRAKGMCKSCYHKEWLKTEKWKEYIKKYNGSEKHKEHIKKHNGSEKHKEAVKKYFIKKYGSGEAVFKKVLNIVKGGESITTACMITGINRSDLYNILDANQKKELKSYKLANTVSYYKHYSLSGEDDDL